MSDTGVMRPAELLRRLNRLAVRRAWEITIAEGAGHTKVRLNGNRTVIPRHTADLKIGTYRAILKQLKLTDTDLEM